MGTGNMRVGIMSEPWEADLDEIFADVRLLQASGGSSYWLTQAWRYDALTLMPSLAVEAPDVEFGSSVVASPLRHPMTLASQALTTSALCKGNFTLGLGLMHKPLIENKFEMSYEKPARRMREYLDILLPLLAQEEVSVSGEVVSYHGGMDIPEAKHCPLLLAAMGPQMLKLCGSRTDGSITWMTGSDVLRDKVRPGLLAAAEAAGRPEPRLVALVPVIITDDVQAGRALAAEKYAIYAEMPSYREMLATAGFSGPEDFALIGTETSVREQIAVYESVGVTDLGIQIGGKGETRDRTAEFVAALCREAA